MIIEAVRPEIDGGRFAIKRCPDEKVAVEATIHADGHDRVAAHLLWRPATETEWRRMPLEQYNAGLNLWRGSFTPQDIGRCDYTLEAWIDRFETWRDELQKKAEADQPVQSELLEGAALVKEAASRASGADRERLERLADAVEGQRRVQTALSVELSELMARYPDRTHATVYKTLSVSVDPERARFSAWYEMFPRSHVVPSPEPDEGKSATFREAEGRLAEIAALGFDILYLPPIHPIGRSFRKGPNNAKSAGPNDPGSPWGIGAEEGGHTSVHPDLGTLEDFDHFVHAARGHGLQIALDLALQCSPDHPWVKEHPEWFRHRPDGSIKYAENPPKKYEDIYPLDFEGSAWPALWQAVHEVVLFWIRHGVTVFRVDNPHTKPYRFWEWLINGIKRSHPETIFLAEAFTRPPVMRYLAKLGFTQSYTYFTWRNTAAELKDYLTELTRTELCEYMRPNFFANTPDIFHEYLQRGGRAAFQIRLILAATLAASYGIYGPPFELCESVAFPGTEDYADSEKYQIRVWEWNRPGNIKDLIKRVNQIRRDNPALQANESLEFFQTNNPQLLVYGKRAGGNRIWVAVNLDPHSTQAGWVTIPRRDQGLPDGYEVEDLLSGRRFHWGSDVNFIMLNPHEMPAHILKVL